jgi:uncharacterized protein (DUF58 family)
VSASPTGRPRRGPTPAFVATLGIIAAPLAQQQRLPLVAVVALAVGLSGFLGRSRGSLSLAVQPRLPRRAVWYVGETMPVVVDVTNNGAKASPVLVVELTTVGLELLPVAVPELRPQERAAVGQLVTLTARRGPALVEPRIYRHNRLVGPDVVQIQTPSHGALLPVVRPRPDLPPAHVVDRMSRPSEEGRFSGRRGAGDPLSLRGFASGDPVSSVHWRSTARTGNPVVMEREQPLSGRLVLLVAGTGEGQEWEAAIARAAGLVQAAAATGVPVSVVAGPTASPLPAEPEHETVQDWLAGLEHTGPAQPADVVQAVRRAAGGLVAVLSIEPWLSQAVRAAGAEPGSVLDLTAAPW